MKIRSAITALLLLGVVLSCTRGFARQEYVSGELTFFAGGKLDEWGDFYPKLLAVALQGSDSASGGRLLLELYYYDYYSYNTVDSWLLGIDSFAKLNLGLLNPYWGLGLGWPYFRLLAGMNLSLGNLQAYVEFNKTFAFGRIPGEQLKLGIGWVFDRTSRQEQERRRKEPTKRKQGTVDQPEHDLWSIDTETIVPNEIRLSWWYEKGSGTAFEETSGFMIERRSERSSEYSVVGTTKEQSHRDTGLPPGAYYYRIRPYGYVGRGLFYSTYSKEVRAKAVGWVTGASLEIINLELESWPTRRAEGVFIKALAEAAGRVEGEVRGEVVNNGTVPFRYVEIIAKFYDYNGILIGTKLASVLDLQAREVWKFRIFPPIGTKPARVVVKVSKSTSYGG